MSHSASYFKPHWHAPSSVHAICTTRHGGFSTAGYYSLNLGSHVQDNPEHVRQNRAYIQQHAQLPQTPLWLDQVHGNQVIEHPHQACPHTPEADACYTTKPLSVCAIMTADCLPVLFCNNEGTQVAAAHAGWRGLLDGVLENTVATFTDGSQVMAYLGPAISAEAFEVGAEVYQAFIEQDAIYQDAFAITTRQTYQADLYQLATLKLQQQGVLNITTANQCTYQNQTDFFSYRRDGQQTGRQACFIWLDKT